MLAIEEHVELKPYNTLALHSVARYFFSLETIADLPAALAFARDKKLPVLMLGGGSNLVLAADFDGLVINNRLQGISFDVYGEEVKVTAAAGENWHQLVMLCLRNGYYGLENLVLIPGSVGAAPIQNIGAYGVELVQSFHSLTGWDTEQQVFRSLSAEDCQFAYRDSIFKHALKGRFYITEVSLQLSTRPEATIAYKALREQLTADGCLQPTPLQVADTVMAVRRSKLPDPAELANAGSFFKNPLVSAAALKQLQQQEPSIVHYPQPNGEVKLAAGWLLQQAGWKGKRVGNVGMHSEQSIVLVNYDSATGSDVLELASRIQQDIMQKFSVQLEIEPVVY